MKFKLTYKTVHTEQGVVRVRKSEYETELRDYFKKNEKDIISAAILEQDKYGWILYQKLK